MSRLRRRRSSAGFTLVEMITVVAIFGLILTLLGLEFVSVVSDTLRTRANTDAESEARTIMSKVENQMRVSYWDYVDQPAGSPLPVVSPTPVTTGATPLDFVAFYRTEQGQLVPAPKLDGTGKPIPAFDLVTIQRNKVLTEELDEIITPVATGVAQPPIVLGNNVTNFQVTYVNTHLYQIALQVTEPSAHCVSNNCSFTLDDMVYVGGQD